MTTPPFTLSPSRLARFFFHECERYLRFRAAGSSQRAIDGIPAAEEDRSRLTQRILAGGFEWEQRIITEHLAGHVIVADGQPDQAVTERRHTVGATIDLLRSAPPGQAIYQPTIAAGPSFYRAYGLDPAVVRFADCHPDLLLIEGDEIVVVDAKASDLMKLSHRIQVALYSILLEHTIADAGISLRVSRRGAVWLYDQTEPERFPMSSVRPPLETFLAAELMPLLHAPASHAFWHLYFRCEWCDYFGHCRTEAETTDNVSLVPYLSTFAKRHLAQRAGVESVEDLRDVLNHSDADQVLDGCSSLEGRAHRLRNALDALRTGEPVATGTASVGMPRGEHIRVIVTLQSEPLGGTVYGFAINRTGGRPIFETGSATVACVAEAPERVPELRAGLVRALSGILRPVDEFNRAASEWSDRKTLQAYVFDSYERDLLVDALLEEAADGEASEDALALLFHFQHPDLAVAEDHPRSEVFFPLIVLTDVVRQVVALPVHTVYRLEDVNRVLQPAEYGFRYERNDYHSFELSNRMKSNAIFDVWHTGRSDLVDGIASELRRRVWAANSVVNGLRELLDETGALFAWPPKFTLPEGMNLHHEVLSRLVFVARYESVLSYLDTRNTRALAEDDRIGGDSSVLLTALGANRFEIDPRQADVDIAVDGFSNWILTVDDDQGRRARLTFDDFLYRDKMYAPKNQPMALAAVSATPSARVIELALRQTAAFVPPARGGRCTLDRRFTDYNTARLIGEIVELDAEPEPWFVRLLANPAGTRAHLQVPPSVRGAAVAAARASMTPSQLVAFEGVLDHDVQLVWGPPGTGKTHFLALTVLALLRLNAGRVLITGFTHNAIDNVLAKLVDIGLGGIECRKLTSNVREGGTVPEISFRDAEGFARGKDRLILGATVWQARKLPPTFTYDVVVIDEGSQLRVAESVLPIRRLRAGGRLVVAGDDRQLPPIVQGDYPVIVGLPALHRSILEALRTQSGDSFTAPLLENWRMCDRLCLYPAASIYPSDYRPATAAVAARRLNLPGVSRSEVTALLLDPAYPVTVVITETVQATRENPFEAGLVADVVLDVRARVADDDDTFWSDRVFVVGPHHAQNRLIRRRLEASRRWDRRPFVDTVDKMQGQECDLVVVSYGVSDVEYALGEKEFIYSLNRLNVAITRGRCKTVVFISRLLLEPPLQALDNDEVAEGIAFMQGLARWCETHGERRAVEHEGHRLTVLRA